MAIGGSSKSRNLLARNRLQKKRTVRRILLETLEPRQLLAVGPQLIGVQPNTGDLLQNGDVLQESPRELVFRFNDGAGIDPATLDGIRVIRSGEDGIFERAAVATDFGTGGQTLVEFYAQVPGESGNGIEVRLSKANRTDTRAPVLRVQGRVIDIELNSNPDLQTRVEDLLQVLARDANTPASHLIFALRLRGSQTIGIAQTADTSQPLILAGANSAKAATNFGLGNNLEVRLIARQSGGAGLGIVVNVTTQDRGGAGAPIVTRDGKTINIELNSNSRFTTTAQEFVNAINSSVAFDLIEARLVSGSGATRVGAAPTTYSPIELTGVTDVEVTPAYVGLGDTNREVIFRFADPLPQDRYRIELLGHGIRTLRNVDGEPFEGGDSRSIAFELELGAQVLSVVPQPVSRDPVTGALSWNRTAEIDIYMNNDPLIDLKSIVNVNGLTLSQLRAERGELYLQNSDTIAFTAESSGQRGVLNPQFYQLINPAGTLTTADDAPAIQPTRIRYYPEANRVSLRYARNLHEYTSAGGELRLRVGTNESQPLAPVQVDGLTNDPVDTFAGAQDLGGNWNPGAGGSQSLLIGSEIRNTTPFELDFPGGSDEPGNRQIRMQDNLRLGADSIDGSSVIFYNFQGQLGVLGGSTLLNAITEQQKLRVREVLSLYERYLGVRFVESDNLGMTIAVGDMRAVSPFPDIVGGPAGVVEPNQPGLTAFEAGTLISNGQPATVLDIQDFSPSGANQFGGTFTRAAMQAVGKLLGLGDADELEQLTVQSFASVFAPGVGTELILPGDGDIVHGQYLYRPDSKDIDLYQFTLPTSGKMKIETFAERMSSASLLDTKIRLFQETNGGWEEIAANDDYFSSDSFLELDLGQGNYIIGVTASGNENYDPVISDTGLGGRSEGRYQLRMDFQPPANSVLRDAAGTELDGDGDGNPGGVFNFWFRPSSPANTKFVDKAAAAGGNGSIATPYKNINTALVAAQPGDVVRILGNGGADRNFATQTDNLAYEIGFDSLGRALPDGSTLDVPRDVSVMIDAGAILKLRRARVGVGSTSVSVDRSGSSLLVLGTPSLQTEAGRVLTDAAGDPLSGSVIFTSLNEAGVGRLSASVAATGGPNAGDWGGIDFRNRVDRSNGRERLESEGLFLDWVSNADIRYGGGQVVVDGTSQVIAPIQMVDSRPSVIGSSIVLSADAAMSATPNSFLESNFHSPAEQRGLPAFTVDYNRVGPEIRGNTVIDNSINGLQVRIRTTSGAQLEKMTVQGRFDDTDIVHFIPENLEIKGTPGGAVQRFQAPSSTRVTLTPQVGGSLAAGTYTYRFTAIDASGVEGPGSEATRTVTTSSTGSIRLTNLPPEVRRIYRSQPGGAGPYTLVGQLAASTGTFIDGGADLGTQLSTELPLLDSRLDARLVIDPGTVIKSQGARIDVDFGAQLIAEGTDGNPVVFTSLNDVRYGAGGTFDTANRQGSRSAVIGDWGGIYVGHTSRASLDHAVISFGGGTTRIEGGFADFGALEIHQADLRLANSRLELNAGGASEATDANRGGRGTNVAGAVFVRGAQPILVDNLIRENRGPAITINVSALNGLDVEDYGRSRGGLDRLVEESDNQGPLVHGNRMSRNSINGMVIRGGNLTTEGVWDDTDITHVVLDEIVVPDFHAFGGLRIESRPNESLVVKFKSDDTSIAGLTATGRRLDNANRIGGSVQLVGTPGRPVVLTSLDDCSASAGFTPTGGPQFQANPSCSISGNAIVDVVLLLDDTGSFASTGPEVANIFDQVVAQIATAIPNADFAYGVSRFEDYTIGGDPNDRPFILNQPVIRTDTPGFNAAISAALNRTSLGFGGDGPESAIEGLWQIATGLGFDGNGDGDTVDSGPAGLVSTQLTPGPGGDVPAFSSFTDDPSGPVLTSSGSLGGVGFRPEATKRIVVLATDIGTVYEPDFVDPYVGKDGRTVPAADLQLFSRNTTPGNRGASIQATIDQLIANNIEVVGLSSGSIAQTVLSGLATLTGAVDSAERPFVFDISAQTAGQLGSTLVQAITSAVVTASPGDWRSILLDPNSNDRNVAVVTENESTASQNANSNGTPATGQFLGGLAPDEKSGDENRRLGYQIHGTIASRSDVDVYSFEAQAGTEVWFDIDRTSNSLDTVVELIDASGRTLALSDNSLEEEIDKNLLQVATDLSRESVNPLRLSTPELYFESASGAPKDLYSTNPRDAGFRVKLPGGEGTTNLYHVRVRSSNRADGDPVSQLMDPQRLHDGLTKGRYQLQIRLSEVDEVPGSSLTYADIRFAQTGLQLVGVPGNSPLLGENSEVENGGANNTFANAQALGNLLQTNRQAISVAGNLDSATDVDWYSFEIDYQRIRPTSIREYFATVFDVDYANGIGRPDTSLYVFDSNGRLILGGLGSDLVDDQASPLNASDNSDLSRGSAGSLDPFIGSYELPAGEYFVAITNSSRIPEVLLQYYDPASASPLLRLQPIEGLRLIAEDHVGFNGGSTASGPIVPDLFEGNAAAVPYGLGDIVLYVTQNGGVQTDLYAVNPFTGEQAIRFNNPQGFDIEDIAFRPNGQLRAFDRAVLGNQGGDLDDFIDYIDINTGTGQFTVIGNTDLQTFHREFDNANPPQAVAVDSNDGVNPEAITFAMIAGQEHGFFVGNRPTPPGVTPSYFGPPAALPNVGNTRPGPAYFSNVLFEFDEATGTVIGAQKTGAQLFTGAGTDIQERGYIETRDLSGNQATLLVAREVTGSDAGQTTFLIRDGQRFTLVDRTGIPLNLVFEFDLGPEARVNYDPAAGQGIRDGMTFSIDGISYEIDTGSVIVVDALSGNQLADGSTVRLRSPGGGEQIYEFDSDGVLSGAGNIAVPFVAADSQSQLTRALANAINLDSGFPVRAEIVPGTNRISLRGASTSDPAVVTGSGLSVSGEPGLENAGATRLAVSEAASIQQFVSAIANVLPTSITVSYEAGRINFSGANTADFGDLATAGIFVDQGSSGAVQAGNIGIRVLVNDTAETVAARVERAINDLGIVGLSASANGAEVQLFGATIADAGPLLAAGVAPGGIVTGIAVIGNTLYAVSDEGGLFQVNDPRSGRTGNVANYVTSSYELTGIDFTALVAGPADTSLTGGVRVLFGLDSSGVIHAFDTSGRLQGVFANGASSAQTGISGANGLAFSTLQRNLWSTTNTNDNTNRENDPGHGLPATSNNSRGASNGGTSYYFGDNGVVNYNFPGGASGALESVPFSLAGLSPSDLPMLYFNYFLETEDFNNSDMRDAFRVYASGDDGNWILLATNNSDTRFELNSGQDVQELFDNTDSWRQARVPLDRLAGQENVKLRIEFSTGGGFGYGLQGGRGPELRTISGDRLIDGQALVIDGQRFEIEMGPTLTLPGGRAINNGEALVIDGTRFVFTDGSGPAVVSPDIAVTYSATDTAAQIAAALQAAVQSAIFDIPVNGGLNFSSEENDTISRATPSGIEGGSVLAVGTGTIGDNATLSDPGQDVDMVRIDVDPGTTVTLNANASSIGSGLDTYLRVFDEEGREVASNDNRPGSTDSRLTFTSDRGGAFYIGVSGAGNQVYNPVIEGSRNSGSTGNYELQIEVRRNLTAVNYDNRLQLAGATLVGVAPDSAIRVQGAAGSNGVAVPVTADMNAQQVAEALQRSVADHFANGLNDRYAIRGGDTIDLTGLNVSEPGPFGLTTRFTGDSFSAFNQPARAQSNNFEGVYIDDFIIGVAGRGEMVLGPTGNNTNFVANPAATNQILTGPYQFEIRGGDEYGIPTTTSINLTRSFDADARSASGLAIRFKDASQLVAGDTFNVGDGPRIVTFELDDVNDGRTVADGNVPLPFNTALLDPVTGSTSPESAEIIAARFRDLLNSAAVQTRIGVAGNLLNNDRVGATSDTVILIGNATADVPSSVGEKLVSEGTGARNRERPQGQVVVNGVRVSNSLEFGISIDAAPRDPVTNAPLSGSPRNTITLNTERLAPGAVVMNSELLFNGSGGISITGDSTSGAVPAASVPFVRLVNNTIVGGEVDQGPQSSPSIEGSQIFELGSVAFADAVVSYSPTTAGGPAPAAGLDQPTAALGAPNYTGSGEPRPDEGVVSLGNGGELIVRFTDNWLTGSGDSRPDLMIFEVGSSERVEVAVSTNGASYTSVGFASATSPKIDLDAFGFDRSSRLAFVRLRDVAGEGSISGDSVGADIDAVGAISSIPVQIFTPGGIGISVTSDATATLLNNVIVNSVTGINVDASSASTIIGGTAFQRNQSNVAGSATLGQFPTVISDNVATFENVARGNLYPAANSPIIDSSIDSLQDRPALVAVKAPLGIGASPILTPRFDINGQLRVDDPNVDSPAGLGEDVFKDRGAQDRADFAGPSVVLLNPTDNDAAGLDGNPAASVVELTGTSPRYFDIQLLDGLEPSDPNQGSGIDDRTVTSASVLLFRNNQPLVEGRDYHFGYDATNDIIRLQPLAGIWESESVYTIRFINENETAFVARPAAQYSDGAQLEVVDGNGQRSVFELDYGYLLTVPGANGLDPTTLEGRTFTLDDGSRRIPFEFDTDGISEAGNQRIDLLAATDARSLGRIIENSVNDAGLNLSISEIGEGRLQLLASSRLVQFDPQDSQIEVQGEPGIQEAFGLRLQLIAGRPAGIEDGQNFSITRAGEPVVFEFDSNGVVQPGSRRIPFTPTDTTSELVEEIIKLIAASELGLRPVHVGDGLIELGGDSITRIDLLSSTLRQSGEAGQPASIPIQVSLRDIGTAADVAVLVQDAIDARQLSGVKTTRFGERVLIEGADGIAGEGVTPILAIRDLAGNPLKANQEDGTTTLTIFLGEGMDYGDAPAPYQSLATDNGPRHTVDPRLSLGPTVTADADARLDDMDSDDGVSFSQLFAAFPATTAITVNNTTGQAAFVSMWIDFNGDGVFSNTERVVNAQSFTQPTTNLTFAVPPSTSTATTAARTKLGDIFARIRVSTDAAAVSSPLGAAPDGEVEDYRLIINANPYQNTAGIQDGFGNGLDVSGDGFVSAIDVLQLINWINDPTKPTNLSLAQATGNPPFVDVNGDGLVSASDVLTLINFINAAALSGEGESSLAMADNASAALAPNSEMVLASDWAGGLEDLALQSSRDRSPVRSGSSNTDLALMDSEEDELEFEFGPSYGPANSADRALSALHAGSDDPSQQVGEEIDEDLLDSLFA